MCTRGEACYFRADNLGTNVLGLMSESGHMVEGYSYEPYGAVTVLVPALGSEDVKWDGTDRVSTGSYGDDPAARPSSPSGNLWFFTGRQYDPEVGLYNYRARHYHPQLGQFMSMDPIGTWGDPANLGNPYAYVGNNPASRTDPSGYYAGADDAVACTGGAAVAVLVQLGVDAWNREWSGWDYVGEAAGGCAGGTATLYGGPIAAGAAYGAVSSATNYGIHSLQGTQDASLGSFAAEVGIGTAAGAAGGALAFGAGKVASTALSKAESTGLQKAGNFIDSGLHAQKGPLARSGHPSLPTRHAERMVVIGEDMETRVIPYAKSIGADYYNPPAAPRSEWMKNNQKWIRDRMDEGCTIIDCGAAPGRVNYPEPTSPFYQMEIKEIGGRGYSKYLRLTNEVKAWR